MHKTMAGHPGGSMGHAPHHAPNQLRLVFWELTARCNLSCIHCRASAEEERSPLELSTVEAKAVIDDLVSFASPILILTGGEPLYRPDIYELAAYASGKGLRVAVATNATLVDGDVARKLAEAGVRRVSISIDGSNEATHDSFRGLPGSFNRALEGAEHLRQAGIEIQFNTTVAKHNVDQVEDVLALAKARGAVALHMFMLVPVGCGVKIADEQMIPAREYERVLNWFYDESRRGEIELKATCAPHYFRIMRQRAKAEGIEVTPKTHGMAAMTKGCLAGSAVCFISREGKVQPCGYLPVEAGNVRKAPLSKIWADSEVFASLRNPDLLGGKCGVCDYKNFCEGCRARAYAATGDYLAEEPYCVYLPPGSRMEAVR